MLQMTLLWAWLAYISICAEGQKIKLIYSESAHRAWFSVKLLFNQHFSTESVSKVHLLKTNVPFSYVPRLIGDSSSLDGVVRRGVLSLHWRRISKQHRQSCAPDGFFAFSSHRLRRKITIGVFLSKRNVEKRCWRRTTANEVHHRHKNEPKTTTTTITTQVGSLIRWNLRFRNRPGLSDSESDVNNDHLIGNVQRVAIVPPNYEGKPKKGHLIFDASFECGEQQRPVLIVPFIHSSVFDPKVIWAESITSMITNTICSFDPIPAVHDFAAGSCSPWRMSKLIKWVQQSVSRENKSAMRWSILESDLPYCQFLQSEIIVPGWHDPTG